jgi:heptosyltransferase I
VPSLMRILVIRAGALGDTLMATPVLPALTQRYPRARIDILASGTAAPLLEGHPLIAEILTLRRRNVPYGISFEKRRLVAALRRAGYDLAIVLEHAGRYYELAERGRIRRITGFRETPFDPALHSIANNLRAAGFEDWATRSWEMPIALTEADDRELPAPVRDTSRPLAGLHAGYGPAHRKRAQEQRLRGWALENFAEVGHWLAARGAGLVLTGSAEDRPAVERLAQMLPAEATIEVAGRTGVRALAATIRRLAVLVSVDSGPAHLAAALGTPLVVMWGPGIYEQTRPVATRGPVEIVREPVECAPCYGTPMMRACQRNICMEGITPARVVAAVERVSPFRRAG